MTKTSVSCRSRNTSPACVCPKAGRWGCVTLPSGLPATAPRAASKTPTHSLRNSRASLPGRPLTSPYLSREEYLSLGIRQSIFAEDERPHVYDLFRKYLAFIQDNDYYDTNILSYQYLPLVEPRYDFVVVDEVQDLTTIQLQLILTSLREPHQFLLCGDANQIVHPNFFSWATLKSFFYQQEGLAAPAELIRILHNNYRNSVAVTEVANRLLKLKHARFGSVDRESNYLLRSTGRDIGDRAAAGRHRADHPRTQSENTPVDPFCGRRHAPGAQTGGPRPFPAPR